MNRYIDAEKLKEQIEYATSYSEVDLNKKIDSIPTADVVEVKHGKWIDFNGYTTCSNCSAAPYHYSAVMTFPYCPICGARMDGDADDK